MTHCPYPDAGISKTWIDSTTHAVVGRLVAAPDLDAAVAASDLVIEAAPESLELKQKIFARIDAAAPARSSAGTSSTRCTS